MPTMTSLKFLHVFSCGQNVCMHAGVCVYVQGSCLMDFVEVSGSY